LPGLDLSERRFKQKLDADEVESAAGYRKGTGPTHLHKLCVVLLIGY
jgi:hypothetical protein